MHKIIYSLLVILLCTILTAPESKAFYSQKGRTYAYGSFGFAIAQINVKKVATTNGISSGTGSRKNQNKTVEVGIGKHITDSFRSDISASFYIGKKKSSITMSDQTNLKVKLKSYALSWNVYYNLLTQSQASPFIMGGLGFGQQDISITDQAAGVKNKSQGGMFYSVGAGVDWHLGAQFDMTFGYKYTSVINSKPFAFPRDGYTIKVQSRNNQTLSVGIRKTF